jgi:hypothetical protein
MTHARTQVRDLFVTALKAIDDMNDKVFAARVNPVAAELLPVILVYTTEEVVETLTMDPPRTQGRVLSVMVDVVLQLSEDYDDELDALQASIETVLGGSAFYATTEAANVQNVTLVAANKIMSGESQTTTCATRLEFRAEYTTRENDPETLT